jgi:antirestriction protein ArdC
METTQNKIDKTKAAAELARILSQRSLEPTNPVTGRTYTRKNRDILLVCGSGSNVWATFKQWQSMGLKVRKGERGVRLVRLPMVKSEQTGELVPTKGAPRTFYVFSAEQVEEWADSSDGEDN